MYQELITTMSYRAPEILLSQTWGKSCDLAAMVGITDEDKKAFRGNLGKNYEKVGAADGKSTQVEKHALKTRLETAMMAGSAPQKVIDLAKLPSKRMVEVRDTWHLTAQYVSDPFGPSLGLFKLVLACFTLF